MVGRGQEVGGNWLQRGMREHFESDGNAVNHDCGGDNMTVYIC